MTTRRIKSLGKQGRVRRAKARAVSQAIHNNTIVVIETPAVKKQAKIIKASDTSTGRDDVSFRAEHVKADKKQWLIVRADSNAAGKRSATATTKKKKVG